MSPELIKRSDLRGGGGSCSSGPDKKFKREDDADGDGDCSMTPLLRPSRDFQRAKKKNSLKTAARTLPPDEPAHKRFRQEETITFLEKDPLPAVVPHTDAIVIEAVVANKLVKRVYIDTGASVSIIFKGCFDQMGVDKALDKSTARPLRSFAQEETQSDGVVELPVTVGRAPTSSTEVVEFFVVRAKSLYNITLGRNWLNAMRAVCSMYHLTMKIPTKGGILALQGDQKIAKECLHIALRGAGAPSQVPHA